MPTQSSLKTGYKKPPTKGQAAVEYLMTYGWALLVLIVIMVVAWQMGLFNIRGREEQGASGFWGLTPEDFKLTSGGALTISFKNNVGGNVTVTGASASTAGYTGTVTTGLPLNIPVGEHKSIGFSNLNPSNAGDSFDVLAFIDYTDGRTSSNHRSSGRIWGTYES